MSGAPRERSTNLADSQPRHAGNKAFRLKNAQKPVLKTLRKVEESIKDEGVELDKNKPISVTKLSNPLHSVSVPSVLRRHELVLHSNLSLSASCSSDASTDSFHSRASTGRMYRTSSTSNWRKQLGSKAKIVVPNGVPEPLPDDVQVKRRCAWVTANTDPFYVTFHDEEWGVPAHDDNKLFELLVLCGALAEITWPAILSRRHIFREVFADFDPIAVAKMNEKKIIAPGSPGSSLLSELKLRAIIDNARQVSKVIDEFGSFDKYIWGFVKHKPIVGRFRYPRQVPVRTSKADLISKDLVRRGFRSVGPTVVYSFMQVAGITNDHLISCFRFHDCDAAEVKKEEDDIKEKASSEIELKICESIDELNFSSE
ncbi:DNA glycosylase superfamily protein [Forsythia ovata]|uniref:DNA glycosylase superfamily protein n=1 Tax=Forsythia ovata TaxID=205694 RepID=A0ABD1PKD1_9LAMI